MVIRERFLLKDVKERQLHFLLPLISKGNSSNEEKNRGVKAAPQRKRTRSNHKAESTNTMQMQARKKLDGLHTHVQTSASPDVTMTEHLTYEGLLCVFSKSLRKWKYGIHR